ncbi:MAG: energy transducer TonB [Bacteroides thetaiotaomicron]|jgi:tonB family C-terminal domain|nr:energy transducer TonB [Bacteroides thetaiotaomicron]
MKKQILFLAGAFCMVSLNLLGQKKYNDLMANQLSGAVKEVNTIRKLHGGVDWGDSDSKWSTQFDNNGHITKSEDYFYKWNANYTQCSCEVPRESGEGYYDFYKFNVNTTNNVYKYEGSLVQYQGTDNTPKGGGETSIEYQFDASGRLIQIVNGTNDNSLLSVSMYSCDSQTFSYKGNERLPYKVVNDMSYGGESWGLDFLIKYEKVDSQGNWLHRKLYNVEKNSQFVEEIRTITYYSETNSPSSVQPATVQQNKVPVFVGGQTAMKKFFADNANPRKPAIATAGYGEVIVEFTVTESGEVTNAKLKARVSVSMDEEALRLVRMMPKWNPGVINGEPVKMNVQVGLRFFPNQAFRYIKTIVN